MKKILALILASFMIFSVVSCTNTPADDPKSTDIIPTVEEGTLGKTLWDAFAAAVAENADATAEELANTLISNPAIQFMGLAMPIEAGFLQGFGEYEVSGFKSGAVYAPMMGSIAFIGYVFEIENTDDIAGFVKNLEDNADPRWNICVTADQTVAGAIGNKVFFLMCPASIDNGSEEGGDVEYIFPDAEDGTVGASFFEAFDTALTDNPSAEVLDIANSLCAAEIVPISLGAMSIEPGLLQGFDNYEVTDFSSGAVFMPHIGSIPFVGYFLRLDDGIDVQNYVNDLAANCNPSWNICVTADQTTIGAIGNTVFFLMSPASAQ